MKLFTTRSVDYLKQLGHDFWKMTLLLRISNAFFWHFEHHKLSAISFQADISTASISTTRLLTLEKSR